MVPVQMLGGTKLIEQTAVIPFGPSPTQAASGGLGRLWMEHCWVTTLLLTWSGTIRKTAPRRFAQQEATGGVFSTRRIHWTGFQNQHPRLPASCPVTHQSALRIELSVAAPKGWLIHIFYSFLAFKLF